MLAHADVDDAVVVGIPDAGVGAAHRGRRRAPSPVARSTPRTARSHVRSRLRGSKTPDRVLVWPELPRTETGKLVRRNVVARIEEQP